MTERAVMRAGVEDRLACIKVGLFAGLLSKSNQKTIIKSTFYCSNRVPARGTIFLCAMPPTNPSRGFDFAPLRRTTLCCIGPRPRAPAASSSRVENSVAYASRALATHLAGQIQASGPIKRLKARITQSASHRSCASARMPLSSSHSRRDAVLAEAAQARPARARDADACPSPHSPVATTRVGIGPTRGWMTSPAVVCNFSFREHDVVRILS